MNADKSLLDIFWIVLSAGLVFIMQPGFMLLESGFTRSKNNINVAIKNFTDLTLSILLFWLVGFTLMYGASYAGFVGFDLADGVLTDTSSGFPIAFFLYQAMFCATAATIVSGAAAERMGFFQYILVTALISGIIYPVSGHWAWNQSGDTGGWLAGIGFVDFAGSMVVHAVGGWVGLAAVLIMGPRAGRFAADGSSRSIPPSNIPLALLGGLLLWFGWFGFNGGSTLAMNKSVAGIIVNTVLAGCGGSLVGLLVGWSRSRIADVKDLLNGGLAGLVAITANCHAVAPGQAILIGAVAGLLMLAVTWALERWKIDDAVGAFPVHAVAGIWGSLAVALFGDPEILGTGLGFFAQLKAQAIGVLAISLWGFGVGYLLLFIFNRILPLRVDAEAESVGLNVSEHGATSELQDLFAEMDEQARTGDLGLRVHVEPFTEVGQIANQYNRVMTTLEGFVRERDEILNTISDGLFLLDEQGDIGGVHSRSLSEIFETPRLAGLKFNRFLGAALPGGLPESVEDFLDLMFRASVDDATLENLNPLKEIELHLPAADGSVRSKVLSFRFRRVIENDAVRALLGSVSDVSLQAELNQRIKDNEERNRGEMERIFSILHVDPVLLGEFMESAAASLAEVNTIFREINMQTGDFSASLNAVYRHVHAVKGNASVLDLEFLSARAHAFEDKIDEIQKKENLSGMDFLPLTMQLSDLMDILGETRGLVDRLNAFQASTGGRAAAQNLLLKTIETTAAKLGERDGKTVHLNLTEFREEMIPVEYRSILQDVLVQLVRNSIRHGIESPAERRDTNKVPDGTIQLKSRRTPGGLEIVFRDDGRGIQTEKLRQKALEIGLIDGGQLDDWDEARLAGLIFEPRLSTADRVDQDAGRGMGMDVIRQQVRGVGGKIKTIFSRGRFCEFQIQLPV